jgi:hypothetical protein
MAGVFVTDFGDRESTLAPWLKAAHGCLMADQCTIWIIRTRSK